MATRIPINKDNIGVENKQDDVWMKMEQDMERRRREWESEIDNMSKDFFSLRTDKDRKFGTIPDKMNIPGSSNDGKSRIEKDEHGHPVFKASFNVQEYKPEEVNVKMEANKVIVHAKHEEKTEGKSVSREYSRELNVPNEIDPMALQCQLGPDGVLTVEAPFPVPDYEKGRSPPLAKINVTHTPNVSSSTFQEHSRTGTPPTGQTFSQPQYSAAPTHQAQPDPFVKYPHHISTATHFQSAPSTTSGYQSVPNTASSFQSAPNTASSLQSAPNTASSFQSAPPYQSSSVFTSTDSPRMGSPITVVKDKLFKIEIDIEDFSPEELTVKTQDKKLNISARRETKIGHRTSSKELSREFHIPDTVDPLTIKAFFTDDGKLVVEAPYRAGASGAHTNGGAYTGASMTGR